MKKFIGKPYAGKPHVRIDEGEKRFCRFSLLYWLKFVLQYAEGELLSACSDFGF
jgi:hypothetical protein